MLKTIDGTPASICSSLRNLAGNKKPRIVEPLLAAMILERWENGTLGVFPSVPVKAKRPTPKKGV